MHTLIKINEYKVCYTWTKLAKNSDYMVKIVKRSFDDTSIVQ